jgi:anti-sigma B factor antagonist
VIGVDVVERDLAPGARVITLSGDVDLYAAPELNERIERALADGTATLVVEFGDGTIIDSTILGVLLSAKRQLDASDGSLHIVCSDARLLRVFTITGLDRRLDIHARVGDAFAG